MEDKVQCLMSETNIVDTSCGKPKIKQKITRRFGGKLEGFKDKDEQRREQKHLKAYLKGHNRYRHGFEGTGQRMRVPVWYPVIEILE